MVQQPCHSPSVVFQPLQPLTTVSARRRVRPVGPASRLRVAIVIFLTLLVAAVSKSQTIPHPDVAVGDSPLAAYDISAIDNVNPVNGNLFLNTSTKLLSGLQPTQYCCRCKLQYVFTGTNEDRRLHFERHGKWLRRCRVHCVGGELFPTLQANYSHHDNTYVEG